MLKELLKNRKFLSKINKFYAKYQNIVLDILLFGSSVKGKKNPNDIDILIIYKDREDSGINYEFKNLFKEMNIEVTSRTYASLLDPSFLAKEAYITDSYSLIRKKQIAESFGMKNMYLFK